MKKLFDTDYVIYDNAYNSVVRWESDGDIIIFGDIDEAASDCRGNESVIPCTEIPLNLQEELINQINKTN